MKGFLASSSFHSCFDSVVSFLDVSEGCCMVSETFFKVLLRVLRISMCRLLRLLCTLHFKGASSFVRHLHCLLSCCVVERSVLPCDEIMDFVFGMQE